MGRWKGKETATKMELRYTSAFLIGSESPLKVFLPLRALWSCPWERSICYQGFTVLHCTTILSVGTSRTFRNVFPPHLDRMSRLLLSFLFGRSFAHAMAKKRERELNEGLYVDAYVDAYVHRIVHRIVHRTSDILVYVQCGFTFTWEAIQFLPWNLCTILRIALDYNLYTVLIVNHA